MKRMWINQPSASQAYHRLHGCNVLTLGEPHDRYVNIETVDPVTGRHGVLTGLVECYLTDGDLVSVNVPLSALSEGWLE